MRGFEEFCPECGALLGRARSLPDLRRYHAIITAAHKQWPDDHPLACVDREEFRARIQIGAGFTHVAEVAIPKGYETSEDERASFRIGVDGAFRADGGSSGYRDLRIRDAALQIIRARSVSMLPRTGAGQREFNIVRDAVTEIIENTLGVGVDQLLKARAA